MKKRMLSALVLAALLLTLPVHAAPALPSFSDVPEKHWASDGIRRAAAAGIFEGIGNGEFGMGLEMSRASYLTALCRLMGWELLTPEHGSFEDNQNSAKWYYSAVETAYANGALTEQSELCRPDEPITRVEMAIMTIRALGYTTLAGIVSGECPFTDVSVGQGYITLAYHMGILKGVGNDCFSPELTAKREEAALVLLRVYERLQATVNVVEGEAPEGVRVVESILDTANFISPRVPLENVYYAVAESGAKALVLRAVPLRQETGKREGEELGADEFNKLFDSGAMRTYRSGRYESSYLYVQRSNGMRTAVWFESERDVEAKVALCRLLGVETVYLVRG